ncbi:MAG TPA: insulinase family protein, partial [Paracoccus sp.]|nr:insulinase family protein [Paracoccus sp. (in: a-proteobacteria)]
GDISEIEVARAKAQLRAGLLMGLESPSAQAERIARVLAIWGRVLDPSEVAQRISDVTLGDVRAHAERLIGRARPALALYGPVKTAPSRGVLAERLAA